MPTVLQSAYMNKGGRQSRQPYLQYLHIAAVLSAAAVCKTVTHRYRIGNAIKVFHAQNGSKALFNSTRKEKETSSPVMN